MRGPLERLRDGGDLGRLAPFARLLTLLDTRLGSHRTVRKTIRLIARLHNVAMMGEPIQQRRGHLGIDKHAGPL